MSELFPGQDELMAQAIGAIHAGADPSWVNAKLKEEAARRGADPEKLNFNLTQDNPEAKPRVDRETKQDYKDIVSGGGTPLSLDVSKNRVTRPYSNTQGLLNAGRQPNSPVGANFDDVTGSSESTAEIPTYIAAGYGLQSTIRKGAAGLLVAAEPLRMLDPNYLAQKMMGQNPEDQNFELATELSKAGQEDVKLAVGKAGAVGQFIGSALGGFIGDPMEHSMEILQKGGSLTDAELENLKGSAENEAGLLSGKIAGRMPGVKGYLARAGAQGATNVGITAADRKLSGEDMTIGDVAMGLGAGVFGGLFKDSPKIAKAKPKAEPTAEPTVDVPETTDVAFEAGKELGKSDEPHNFDFDAAFQRQTEAINKRMEAVQGDLFSGNKPEQTSLFGDNPVDAELAESRRGMPDTGRSTIEQAALEAGYAFDQQAQQPLFDSAQDIAASKMETGNPAMAEAMGRTGLAPEPTQQYFEPTHNPQVEQVPPQQGELLPQRDMFDAQQAPPRMEEGLSPYAQRKARLAAEAQQVPIAPPVAVKPKRGRPPKAVAPVEPEVDLKGEIERAKARRNNPTMAAGDLTDRPVSEDNKPVFRNSPIPRNLVDSAKAGTLKAREVLDTMLTHPIFDHPVAKEAKEWVRQLRELGEKFGGLDVPLEIHNSNDFSHADMMSRSPTPGKVPFAAFDPIHNKIALYHTVGNSQMVHEVGHAILSHVMALGEAGELTGASRQAFATLQNLFEGLQPELQKLGQKRAKPIYEAHGQEAADAHYNATNYGLQNIHEFMSEMFSNQTFRDHLRAMPVTDTAAATLGGLGRAALGKVKNMYEAVVKTVRNVLGLSDKADNALDAMFSASKTFFDSVGDHESAGVRKFNSRRPTSDLSFLGERAEPRFAGEIERPKDENLQKPRGKFMTGFRALLASKGIDPTVTAAGRLAVGHNAAAKAEAIHAVNRINAVTTDANKADLNKALQGDVDAYSRLGKDAKDVVADELGRNEERIIALSEELAKNPSLDQTQKRTIASLLKDAVRAQAPITEATHIPGSMPAKFKLYEKAVQKVEAKRELSSREQEAVASVTEAKGYLEGQWFPKDVADLPSNELKRLFKYHTGKTMDKALGHLEGDAKKDAARNIIMDRIRGVANKDGAIENILKASMDIGDKRNPLRQYYRALRNNALKGKDIPSELFQLWNPISHPAARVAANLLVQQSRLANAVGLNALRESGMGKIFTENGGTKTHGEPLQGERYGPLQGLWTSPDIKRAIDDTFGMIYLNHDMLDNILADAGGSMEIVKKLGKMWVGLGSHVKAMSVVYNPGNYVLNLVGSPLQWISNGNFVPGKNHLKGFRDVASLINVAGKKEMPEHIKDLFKYHLVEYSQIQDLKGTEHGNIIASIMKNAAKADDPMTKWQQDLSNAVNADRKTLQTVKETYGAMDLHTKFANWYNEVDFWTKYAERNKTGETQEQIKRKAAERINDTNISPSLAPKIIKNLEGATASFLPYYSEIARTLGYNIKYAMEDMKKGATTGDHQLLWHGSKRLIGAAAAMVGVGWASKYVAKGIAGATGLVASALTDDNDERRKYMKNDPFLSTQHPILLSDPNHPDAGEFVFDEGRADPYAPVTELLRTGYDAMHATLTGDKKQAHDYADLMYNQTVNLFNRNVVWSMLGGAISGKKPRLENDNKARYDELRGWMTNNLDINGKQADAMMMMFEKINPSILKNLGKEESSSPIMDAANKAGIGVMKLDVAKDVSNYLGGASKDAIQGARTNYLDLMKQNYDNKPERVEEDFKQTLIDAAKPYEKLKDAVAAARAQGSSRGEMMKRLKAAGVSNELMYAIFHNKPLSPAMVDGDLKKDYQRDLIDGIDDPEKKQEAKKRFKTNSKLMKELVRKYKNVPLEELE